MTALDRIDAELLALAHAIDRPDHPVKVETAAWAAESLATRDMVDADHAAEFSTDDWKRCADRGIFRTTVPTELGGTYTDLATAVLTLEGLGQGCRDNGLTFAIGSQMITTQETLVKFGNDAQRAEWLEPLMAGDVLAAFAITEPETGSDAYGLATTAVEQPDGGYVLDGHKSYISFGPRCDMVMVFAATDPDAGAWGLSAFLVPTDLDGVERTPNRPKMGLRTTPFGDIVLHDVHVPASALIGRRGAGASIFNTVVQLERALVFATQVGVMQRQLDTAVAYANDRRQGGRPIGTYQAVSHRIADMKVQLETARLFVYRAAIATVSGQNVHMTAALSKLVGADAGIATAMSAVSVHGAPGFVTEFEIERDLRDAIGGLAYSGTGDIQRNIIARLLGVAQ